MATVNYRGQDYTIEPVDMTHVKFHLTGRRQEYSVIERMNRPGSYFVVNYKSGKVMREGLRMQNDELVETI